jgi:hypothetical protein
MTWIYFAFIDESQIKIGKADNVAARLRQHAKGTLDVHDVRLLAAVNGSPVDEKQVQRYFSDCAIAELRPANNGQPEMFLPSPELTNYIRWLRNQWYTVVSIDDDAPDSSATFDMWRPNEGRQVAPVSLPLFTPDYTEFPGRVVTGDDYYTNPIVLECARKTLGQIDLDPASHPIANRHVKAEKYYTFNCNGLEQTWGGQVWLNPPFSQWKLWVPKILSEVRSGRVHEMCVYSAMRTITARYFRKLLDEANAMCVITGRMKHGGNGGDSPDDGHCVFYFGQNTKKFTTEFSEIGVVWGKPA